MIRVLLLLLSLLLLSWASLFVPSGAEAVNPHPQELRSFKIRETQLGRGCSYTVKIKTSCYSSRYTRDIISIAFGDAYQNQVYAPRLDDPSSGTFERCSTDTFKIQGPCGYGICYLYLRREGYDGWIPDWVQIYDRRYGRSITFYYGASLPNAVWFGFNQCVAAVVSSSSSNATGELTGGEMISKM